MNEQHQKPLIGIFVVVLFDIVGFSMIIPVLPYYAAGFGATPSQVGLISGLYALCQFIAAPLIGRLSDTLGRKPMFILDIAGSIIGYIILVIANSFEMILISRIIAGSVAATIPVAQAYIADCTPIERRSRALGLIGVAFGVGFTIGPALGGWLAGKYGYIVTASVALFIASCNIVFVVFGIRESRISTRVQGKRLSTQPTLSLVGQIQNTMYSWAKAIVGNRKLTVLFLFWFIFSITFALFQQNITLFNKIQLLLTARESSYIFAYIGVLVALTQGWGLKFVTQRFSDIQLLRFCSPILAGSLVLWAFTAHWLMLLFILIPLCIAGSIMITVTNSLLTKTVTTEALGGALGLSGAIDNITRVTAAFAGGLLIQRYGAPMPAIVAAVCTLGLLYVCFVIIHKEFIT